MSNRPALPDAAARSRITHDLDAALFVEAGAGTGKTTALVSRILALIAAGVDVRNIAAITFTEAAAAELRDRIRLGLEETLAGQATVVPVPVDPELARNALDNLDGAAFETLHAFARRLLGLYPVETGLPPRFEIADEIAFGILADEEWDRVLDGLLSDPVLVQPLTYALALGVKLKGRGYQRDLRDVFDAFGENWDRLPSEPFPHPPFVEPDVRRLLELVRDMLQMRRYCDVEDDGLLQYINLFESDLRRLSHASTPVERARLLPRFDWSPRGRYGPGKAENWSGMKPQALERAREVADECQRLVAELGPAALYPILEYLRKAALEFAARRRREGTLAFHDLLVLARELLRNNPVVRRELHHRYTRILIDEFQDTDPLQAEIAALLARPSDDEPLEPGRVFFVGDPKQSIYRFRRADIQLYQASRMAFACEQVELTGNFRSSQAVIDWCNAVFAEIIGQGTPGQADYEPLTAERAFVGGGKVHLLGGERDARNLDALRDEEAAAIAAAIQAIRAGSWEITDPRTKERRPANYDDIALLLPTRTTLPFIQRAFEDADVPYRVESQSLVYNTQEVRDLINILAAIDDPTDEVAVVAALRSPAFACGDDDLLRHRQAGGRWDYMAWKPGPEHAGSPVARAFAMLQDLHERRFWMPCGDLVDRVIRDCRLRELAFAHRRPRELWQRYRFVLEQVRSLEANRDANLHRLVAWLRRQAEEQVRVNDAVRPEADDDAVRIMTIHAAKGLEFPIVVMAGLNTGEPSAAKAVLWSDASVPEVKLGSIATPGYDALLESERSLDRLERNRRLYVAATRARDHLVVSCYYRAKGGERYDAQHILAVARKHPGLWSPFEPARPLALPSEPTSFAAPPLPPREIWLTARDELLRRNARRPNIAVTAIAHGDGEEPEKPEPPQAEDDRSFFRRGRGGTSVGRAVHAVLQAVDLESGIGLDDLALAEAAAEGVPARAEEVARLARAALDSDAVRAAVASTRYWREVFVGLPVDGRVLEGFVDLLYESPEGLVVVDYKTDAVRSDDEIAAAMGRYSLQGAAYALALERALQRPVAGCSFVFLRPQGTRTVHVEGLRDAVAEVEARLAAPA